MKFLIPLGHNLFAEVDEIDFLPALLTGSWCLNSSGYVTANNAGVTFLHWFVAERMGLKWETTIDHKDRCKLNCKRENLRVATQGQQLVNKGQDPRNTSGHKCICWHMQRKKWHVQVKRNGKKQHVALCSTIEEAIRQRDAYLKRHNMELI